MPGTKTDPSPSPEWTSDGTHSPICYEKDSAQQLNVIIHCEPSSISNLPVTISITEGSTGNATDTFTEVIDAGDNMSYIHNHTNQDSCLGSSELSLGFDLHMEGEFRRPRHFNGRQNHDNTLYTIYGSPSGSTLTESRPGLVHGGR